MDIIRLGMMGLGPRARSWLRVLGQMRGYRVTALCDPFESLRRQALALLPDAAGVRCYSRHEEMLADPNVDAVGICVRRRDVGALAAEALEAGKHVNCEVPAAHTLEDCWRIIVAAERTGKVYHLAEQTRFWGFIEAWRDLVQAGRLGRITYGEGQYIGFYGSTHWFWNPQTGEYIPLEELDRHPEAVPTFRFPQVARPDIQVALMKTEKDALLQLACGFTQPVSHARGHHWYRLMGTRGSVEWKRSGQGKPLLWLADSQMHDMAEMDWRQQRTDAPAEAWGSGHGDADFYVHAAFRDAVLGRRTIPFDVYKAIDTAAPAIVAEA